MNQNEISRTIDFHTFITKVIEICGRDRLRTPKYVEYFMSSGTLLDPDAMRMVTDMAEGKVFSLFLDEPEDAYEKSREILKDTYHHDDTEITSYLDDLKDVLEHMDPNKESENERMLREAKEYAFSTDCQDYERAARLIEETTFWKCPRGIFISFVETMMFLKQFVLYYSHIHSIQPLVTMLERKKERIQGNQISDWFPYIMEGICIRSDQNITDKQSLYAYHRYVSEIILSENS